MRAMLLVAAAALVVQRVVCLQLAAPHPVPTVKIGPGVLLPMLQVCASGMPAVLVAPPVTATADSAPHCVSQKSELPHTSALDSHHWILEPRQARVLVPQKSTQPALWPLCTARCCSCRTAPLPCASIAEEGSLSNGYIAKEPVTRLHLT